VQEGSDLDSWSERVRLLRLRLVDVLPGCRRGIASFHDTGVYIGVHSETVRYWEKRGGVPIANHVVLICEAENRLRDELFRLSQGVR